MSPLQCHIWISHKRDTRPKETDVVVANLNWYFTLQMKWKIDHWAPADGFCLDADLARWCLTSVKIYLLLIMSLFHSLSSLISTRQYPHSRIITLLLVVIPFLWLSWHTDNDTLETSPLRGRCGNMTLGNVCIVYNRESLSKAARDLSKRGLPLAVLTHIQLELQQVSQEFKTLIYCHISLPLFLLATFLSPP